MLQHVSQPITRMERTMRKHKILRNKATTQSTQQSDGNDHKHHFNKSMEMPYGPQGLNLKDLKYNQSPGIKFRSTLNTY